MRSWLATLANHEKIIPMLVTTTAKHFDRVKSLEAIVDRAAKQFRYYEAQHEAKGTPEASAKALVNAQLADILEAALVAPILTPKEVAARKAFDEQKPVSFADRICDCGVLKGTLKTPSGCGCLID